jgi:Ca2+-binding EF-hand superfamily protein
MEETMKKLSANLLLVAAVLMLSVSAFAAEETAAPTFQTIDVNQDGFISGEEAATIESLTQNFKKIDANQDGKLDEAEFAAYNTTQEQG